MFKTIYHYNFTDITFKTSKLSIHNKKGTTINICYLYDAVQLNIKTFPPIFLESLDRNEHLKKKAGDKSDNFGEEEFGHISNLTV